MSMLMIRIKDLIEQMSTDFATLISGETDVATTQLMNTGVLPSGADEKTVTGGAGAWAQGSWVEIASTVGASDIVVREIHVVSATGVHQVELGTGAAASEVALAKRSVSAGSNPMQTVRIPAGTRLAARTASKAGGAQAVTINVVYDLIA